MDKVIPKISFPLFIFFAIVAFFTPLTGDDWTWGTFIGTDRLSNFFKDYNGRYLSNVLEIIMTRSPLIRILFFALFSTLLIVLTGKLISSKRNITINFAFFLFMLIPTAIYAQTFGWLAGFVNYIPSVVLLLAYLVIIKNVLEPTVPQYKKYTAVLIAPFAFFSTLIVEHVTLFALLTGFMVIAYTYYVHKKIHAVHISYFISTLIGSIVMFTNGAYLKVFLGEDTYRTVREYDNIFDRFYTTFKQSMYQILFMDNKLIWLIVSILVCILLLKTKNESKSSIENKLKPLLLFNIISFNLFNMVFDYSLGHSFLGTHTKDAESIFTLIFFCSIVIASILFVKNKTIKIRLIYYVSGIIFLTIPFVFITPYGPRCVFGTYTFIVLFALELLVYLAEEYQWSLDSLNKALTISNVILVFAFSFILSMNYFTNKERIGQMYNDVNENKTHIVMRELPFPQYHWMPTPKAILTSHSRTFKIFYDIPTETEIEVIPYFKSQRNN